MNHGRNVAIRRWGVAAIILILAAVASNSYSPCRTILAAQKLGGLLPDRITIGSATVDIPRDSILVISRKRRSEAVRIFGLFPRWMFPWFKVIDHDPYFLFRSCEQRELVALREPSGQEMVEIEAALERVSTEQDSPSRALMFAYVDTWPAVVDPAELIRIAIPELALVIVVSDPRLVRDLNIHAAPDR